MLHPMNVLVDFDSSIAIIISSWLPKRQFSQFLWSDLKNNTLESLILKLYVVPLGT